MRLPPPRRVCLLVLVFLFLSVSNGRVHPWSSFFARQLLSTSSSPSLLAAPSSFEMKEEMEGDHIIHHHHHLSKDMAISISLIVLAAVVVLLSIIFGLIFCRRNRKGYGSKDIQPSSVFSKLSSLKLLTKKEMVAMMDYSVLELATNNFSENNVLGEGRIGFIYRARLDGGDVLAAVKKVDAVGLEHDRILNHELDLYGRIRHPNIASLLGYCIRGDSRFLVYELPSNGSLRSLLHGASHGRSELSWHLRMKIALDTARGLEYLHETCSPAVIHRDLNSSNILLDSKFNAKISDFGLAVTGFNQINPGVKFSVASGYIAPEYFLDGKLTEKSDVYAFGVVLLELMLGRNPAEETDPSLVAWAMPQLTDRTKLPNIVDPAIRDTMDLKHLYQVAAVAVLCVQAEASYRPLITDVLHSLIPLVPVELGGALRGVAERLPSPPPPHMR